MSMNNFINKIYFTEKTTWEQKLRQIFLTAPRSEEKNFYLVTIKVNSSSSSFTHSHFLNFRFSFLLKNAQCVHYWLFFTAMWHKMEVVWMLKKLEVEGGWKKGERDLLIKNVNATQMKIQCSAATDFHPHFHFFIRADVYIACMLFIMLQPFLYFTLSLLLLLLLFMSVLC